MTTIDEARERDRAIPDLDWRVFPDGTVRDVFAAPSGGLARRALGVAHRGRVVLLPGVTGSKEDFTLMFPLLADAGYRVESYRSGGSVRVARGRTREPRPAAPEVRLPALHRRPGRRARIGPHAGARARLLVRRTRRPARARRASRAVRESDAAVDAARDGSGVPWCQADRLAAHSPEPASGLGTHDLGDQQQPQQGAAAAHRVRASPGSTSPGARASTTSPAPRCTRPMSPPP